jgi:poly(A) polymerase
MTARDARRTALTDEIQARFAADPLTMLAVVREAGETGREPPPSVRDAVARAVPAIRRVRKADIAAALLEILTTPHPIVALETMTRTGLMALLLPEVEALQHMPPGDGRHKDVYRHTLLVVARTPPDPISRLAALLHDIGKPATKLVERGVVRFPGHAEVGAEMTRRRMRELGFDRPTTAAVTLLVALHLRVNSYEQEWTDSAARRLAREAGDQFERLLDLSRADVTSARREAVERALRRVDALEARVAALRAAEEKPQSPLDGNELMAMFGRPPGRWIGEVKNHLAALVGAGELAPDDRQRAATIARTLVAGMDEGGQTADGRR